MNTRHRLLLLAGAALLALAGCDDSDVVSLDAQDQFGSDFEQAFEADETDDPTTDLTISVAGTDGVDLTADPIDV